MKSLIESIQTQLPIDEENTTSNIDGYSTPYAFTDEDDDANDRKLDEMYRRLINEASYKDFKNDNTSTAKQKINGHITEINKRLYEIERMMQHATKLKMESGADQTVFWKSTMAKFQKIDNRLNKLSNTIREINT
jgi:hypothetical protein